MKTVNMLKAFSRVVLIFLCSVVYQQCEAKILIIVPVYNRPDFIEMQHKTFKKFLQEDYELMMFNDANDPVMKKTIEATCRRLGITCVRVPQELHNVDPNCHKFSASYRHGEVMQFAFENYGFYHDDIVMLIDSDVFLIREFSVRNYLGDCDLFGVFQNCLVPQLCFLNMPKLENPQELNFRADIAPWNGCLLDAGTLTDRYLLSHRPKWRDLNPTQSILNNFLDRDIDITSQLLAKGFSGKEINLIVNLIKICDRAKKQDPSTANSVCYNTKIGFYENNLFLDYKHGSGWHNPNVTDVLNKDRLVKDFIESIL